MSQSNQKIIKLYYYAAEIWVRKRGDLMSSWHCNGDTIVGASCPLEAFNEMQKDMQEWNYAEGQIRNFRKIQ